MSSDSLLTVYQYVNRLIVIIENTNALFKKNLLLFENAEHTDETYPIRHIPRETTYSPKHMIYASRYDLRNRVFDRLLGIFFSLLFHTHSINIVHRTACLNFHIYFPYNGDASYSANFNYG